MVIDWISGEAEPTLISSQSDGEYKFGTNPIDIK